jgi:hypothetical protein
MTKESNVFIGGSGAKGANMDILVLEKNTWYVIKGNESHDKSNNKNKKK